MSDGDAGVAGEEAWAALAGSPEYRRLLRERGRWGWVLTAIMLIVYFGYILLIAFDPAFLAKPIGGGTATVGIPLGIGVILVGILLTGVYVRRANRRFDLLEQAVRRQAGA